MSQPDGDLVVGFSAMSVDQAQFEAGVACIATVPVDDVTLQQAAQMIDAMVRRGRVTSATAHVVTINVDFVVNALSDAGLLRILQRAELSIPDGMPIVWHSLLSRTPLRERVAGADLVPLLVDRSRSSGHRVLLFGSANGVAEEARDLLRSRYPGALVDAISGPIMSDIHTMDASVLDEINTLAPDIVCVALGNPKQEKWIDLYRHQIGACVFIGVGGTLDFLVGGRRRAPAWIRRCGLEWLVRAIQEPRRLGRRYLRDLVTFGPLMLGAVCSQWTRLPGSRPDVRWMDDDRYRRRIIDGATITGCDPRSLCTILGLGRSARRGGCGVVVRTSSQALVKGLSAVDGATFEYESAARSPGNDEAILHS